jgi:uncharacterized protein YdhG (YjbR/CyaY superfamily)
MGTVDDYLAGLDDDSRAVLARVIAVALIEAPDATQGTSYGAPALLVGRRPLLGIKAANGVLSVFPFSPAAIDAVSDRLGGAARTKGMVRFGAAAPLPDDVVRDMVRSRLTEIVGP